jgi:uncharacterized protein YcbK (DUF882 family)
MRPEDWAGIRHFSPAEFSVPERMGYEFVKWLDALRALCGFALKISSDVRTPEQNEAAEGATKSAHMDVICDTVDISAHCLTGAKRLRLVIAAYTLGCRRFGVYENGSVHIDCTEDRRPHAMWVKV